MLCVLDMCSDVVTDVPKCQNISIGRSVSNRVLIRKGFDMQGFWYSRVLIHNGNGFDTQEFWHTRVLIHNNNENFLLRLKMQKQTHRRRWLHIGRTHDQHLEACYRGISFCKAGDNPKQPSSRRLCYQHLNGAKLCLSDLSNDDSRGRIAGCS